MDFLYIACDYTKYTAGVAAAHIFSPSWEKLKISAGNDSKYKHIIYFQSIRILLCAGVDKCCSGSAEGSSLMWFDPFSTEFPLALATFLVPAEAAKGEEVQSSSHPTEKKTNGATVPPRAAHNQFLFGPRCDSCFCECCWGWKSQRKLFSWTETQ